MLLRGRPLGPYFSFELSVSNMCHLSVFVENEINCENSEGSILLNDVGSLAPYGAFAVRRLA